MKNDHGFAGGLWSTKAVIFTLDPLNIQIKQQKQQLINLIA